MSKKVNDFKSLSKDIRDDMDTRGSDGLKDIVINAELQLEELKKELADNQTYQSALSVKKDFEGGQREVKKVLRDKIKYALFRLEQAGKA